MTLTSPPPIMKKLLYKGEVVEVKEKNLIWLEKELKRTGETVDEAIDRLTIEFNEEKLADEIRASRQQQQHQQLIHDPNTLDHYLCTPTTHVCK